MKSYRSAGIPIDHIIAEIAAFPVASEAAFRLRPTALYPVLDLDNKPTTLYPILNSDNKTAQLWRAAENILLTSFPGFSIDEVVSARDRIWFRNSAMEREIPLHRFLRGIADSYLRANGPIAFPRLDEDERIEGVRESSVTAGARRALRWLLFAIPGDLLLASLKTSSDSPERIEILAPSIYRLLREKGYVEPHLHVGASLDYGLLWNSLMFTIADSNIKPSDFCSPGASLNEGKNFAPLIIRAAICRYVLSDFLTSLKNDREFLEYLYNGFYKQNIAEMGSSNFSLLLKTLADLESGRENLTNYEFAAMKMLYSKMSQASAIRFPRRIESARRTDPISRFFRRSVDCNRCPEMSFISASLEYLEKSEGKGTQDKHFSTLFWQIVRIRNLFYRHILQRPLTPGLQWFVRFYARTGAARKRIKAETYLEYARCIEGRGCQPRSIEIRTSPDYSISKLLSYVRKIDKIYQAWSDETSSRNSSDEDDKNKIEIGLVFHFAKDRGGGAKYGKPGANWIDSYANPQENPAGYRYSRFYQSKLRPKALSLEWLLRRFPVSLEIVRGIDVCADELGVPNWVLTPIFQRIRGAAADGANSLRYQYGLLLPSFRTTVHAGEDFVHLLTGLRYVDQAIEQYGLLEGDRIGHGLSLGVEPKDWATRAGRIPVIMEERLFDLVWEWSWYGKQWCQPDGGRAVYLQREIEKLSERIFALTLTPFDLEKLMQDLCNTSMLGSVGFPEGKSCMCDFENCNGLRCSGDGGSICRTWLLHRYLTSVSLFQTGRQVMWIDPFNEANVLAVLQSELRRKLGALGIVVEVNPTSNLLIGDLSDLSKHPLWRLRPPTDDGDAPPVSVCIGSDDPVIFGTSLPEEYQSLCDAMILAGLSEEEARQWIDRTRQTGLESRFTLPRSRRGSIVMTFNTQNPSQPMPI